jgi:hypothetical protein
MGLMGFVNLHFYIWQMMVNDVFKVGKKVPFKVRIFFETMMNLVWVQATNQPD